MLLIKKLKKIKTVKCEIRDKPRDSRPSICGKFYYNGKICDYVNTLSLNIIATPDMFGWLYNEGPPHDHNRRWIDSRYLEDYIELCLISVVRNNFKMSIIVDGVLPKLHDGKIIIDRYDLLRNCNLTIIK